MSEYQKCVTTDTSIGSCESLYVESNRLVALFVILLSCIHGLVPYAMPSLGPLSRLAPHSPSFPPLAWPSLDTLQYLLSHHRKCP